MKLDEIIRALEGAHNGLLDLEELEEAELDRVRERYEDLARRAREGGKLATGCPDLDAGNDAPATPVTK